MSNNDTSQLDPDEQWVDDDASKAPVTATADPDADEPDATKLHEPVADEPAPAAKQEPAQKPAPDTHDAHETAPVTVDNEGADELKKSTRGRTATIACLGLIFAASVMFITFAGSGSMARNYGWTFTVVVALVMLSRIAIYAYEKAFTDRYHHPSTEEERKKALWDAVVTIVALALFVIALIFVFHTSQAFWVFAGLFGNDSLTGMYESGIIHNVLTWPGTAFVTKILAIGILLIATAYMLKRAFRDGSKLKAVIIAVSALIIGYYLIMWLTAIFLQAAYGLSGVAGVAGMPFAFLATGWLMVKPRLTLWSLLLAVVAGLLWLLPLGWSTAVVWGV